MKEIIEKIVFGTKKVLKIRNLKVWTHKDTPILFLNNGEIDASPIIAPKNIIFGFILDDPTKLKLTQGLEEELALSCNCQSVIILREKGTLYFQYSLDKKYWKTLHYAGESIGTANDGKKIIYEFNQDAPHSIIGGSTGSGKSELIRTIIHYLSDNDNVRFVIVDPKGDYNDLQGMKRLALSVANDEDLIRNAIQTVHNEMLGRISTSNLDAQRIVLIIDEAQSEFALGDRSSFNDENFSRVKDISQRGRAPKINLIIGTQNPNHTDLGAIYKNLTYKFVGKVADKRTAGNIAGAGVNAQNLLGYGDFLLIQPNNITRFQGAISNRNYEKGVLPTPFNNYIDGSGKITPEILAEYITRNMTPEDAALLGVKHTLYQDFSERLKDSLNKGGVV